MTRINTNVSSLIAQNTLQRSNVDLQQSLTRLSTGLRINRGADDPSGLIASENLRSEIGAVRSAIGNSERANQVIATADSALSQVSDLLNDVRGLVTEAANSGALSDDEIAANQLQLDSSLDALNRISKTTSFQGRRLLDGSLEFITVAGGGFSSVSDLSIDQANLGALGQVGVNVNVTAAATQAELTNNTAVSDFTNASDILQFAAEERLVLGNGNIDISAPGTSIAAELRIVDDAGHDAAPTAVFDPTTGANGRLTITFDVAEASTLGDFATAINNALDTSGAATDFTATASAPAALLVAADDLVTGALDADIVSIQADVAGPDFNNLAISVVVDTVNVATTAAAATYDSAANTLVVSINDTATTAVIAAAITGVDGGGVFTATGTASTAGIPGSDDLISATEANDIGATADTGTSGGGVLLDDLVLEISGQDGAEVRDFEAGTSIDLIVAGINQLSDATGVTATNSSATLTLNSSAYGSNGFVDVNVISEGSNGTFSSGLITDRVVGTDILATVNGITANGDGNELSINTSTLALSATVDTGSSTDFNFTITGGGALFQLGPDVVSTQQARIGITSVNTARLGGAAGRLFELGDGKTASLANDPNLAANIVDEAINQITTLRGRLGAFQRTTVDTNIASLNDTLANLTDAESQIRDADFAAETAALTRAQILVQSGTSVLSIANSNPQNVLALLR